MTQLLHFCPHITSKEIRKAYLGLTDLIVTTTLWGRQDRKMDWNQGHPMGWKDQDILCHSQLLHIVKGENFLHFLLVWESICSITSPLYSLTSIFLYWYTGIWSKDILGQNSIYYVSILQESVQDPESSCNPSTGVIHEDCYQYPKTFTIPRSRVPWWSKTHQTF